MMKRNSSTAAAEFISGNFYHFKWKREMEKFFSWVKIVSREPNEKFLIFDNGGWLTERIFWSFSSLFVSSWDGRQLIIKSFSRLCAQRASWTLNNRTEPNRTFLLFIASLRCLHATFGACFADFIGIIRQNTKLRMSFIDFSLLWVLKFVTGLRFWIRMR